MHTPFNRKFTMSLAALFLIASPAFAQKYALPFPRDGVTKAQEDALWAIWDVNFEQHKSTGMVQLPLDQITVFLREDAVKITRPDGTYTIEQNRLGAIRFESKGTIRAEEGLSDYPSRAMVFQLKDAVPPKFPITEGIPDQLPRPGADLLFENDRVQVYDQTFRPGAPSPRHQHYALTSGVVLVAGKTLVIPDPENGVQKPNQVNDLQVGGVINHKALMSVPHRESELEGEPRLIYLKLKGSSL